MKLIEWKNTINFLAFVGIAVTEHCRKLRTLPCTLGAYTLGGQRMIIPTKPAQILIDKYFKS